MSTITPQEVAHLNYDMMLRQQHSNTSTLTFLHICARGMPKDTVITQQHMKAHTVSITDAMEHALKPQHLCQPIL